MNKIIILLTITLVSVFSEAATKDFTIAGLGISTSSNTIFLDVEQNHGHATCSDQNSFRLSTSSPLYKEIYATLLAAKAANKTVSIGFGDSDNCLYNSPIIGSVYIK